jgi:hypothetical protein
LLLIAGLSAAAATVNAQGLRAGGGLASEELLDRYWDSGGLKGFIQTLPKDESRTRPLLGGWAVALGEDSGFSVGLGWQPGKTTDELGYLGAAGASWRQRFYGLWDPVLTAGLSVMRQPHQESGQIGELYGAHVSLGLNPANDWGISVGLGYRDAMDSNPLATAAERIEQRAVYGDLAAVYRLQRNVELQGQITGLDLRHRSNLLQDPESTREVGVRMRYFFD